MERKNGGMSRIIENGQILCDGSHARNIIIVTLKQENKAIHSNLEFMKNELNLRNASYCLQIARSTIEAWINGKRKRK